MPIYSVGGLSIPDIGDTTAMVMEAANTEAANTEAANTEAANTEAQTWKDMGLVIKAKNKI
jgi:hypothetical protein